jgi:opacity protein-like surface antigen
MRRVFAGGLIFLALLMVRTPVAAEAFIDLYGGASFTQSRRMTVERFFASEVATRKVSYDGGFVIGARGGAWLDWFGLGLDFSYFRAAGDLADIDVFSNSVLVMARAPLMKTDEFPDGQLQPYVMVGPGFFFADTHTDFRPDVSVPVAAFSFDDVGIDLRAGAAWRLPGGFAVFSEYRFTWFNLHADDGFGSSGTEFISSTLATHHIIGGLSIRF